MPVLITAPVSPQVSCYARPHNLHALLEPAAQIAISEGLERALAIGETLLAWENEPHTTSQAYLDIVQQSADAPASAKKFAQGINAKRSKEPATEEHALVELQLKTYAYWHVMKRRLLDYVQLGTHAEVCTATVEWRLRQHLARAIDECPNLVELMSADEKRMHQLKERSRDLERLRVASAWIKEVRARVRERGASVGAS
jgi:hypothetical protein